MSYEEKIMQLTDDFANWWDRDYEIPKMTNELYPYKALFSPIQVNKLIIKNRIVMGPIGNINMCDETGRPSPKMLKYFEERAKGGVGLITTGLIPVSHGIDYSITETDKLTYFPRIDRTRTVLAAWRNLASMCNTYGAALFIQLSAGLGRVGNPECLIKEKKFPRSASINPNWYMKDVPCLRLSDRSLGKIIKNMGQASADAKACNINGVYLHGHEGYLLEQLANPAFNRRKLGKYADYERFGIDTVKEIRKRVGPDYPIMYRIDLTLALEETYREKMNTVSPLKKFRNGRTVAQSLEYMEKLTEAGVDMFDVDMGCYDNWWLPHPPSSMPPACFLDLAQLTKKYFADNKIKSNKGLTVPVVAVGKLGYPDLAEKVLRDKKCDMIMLARPLLADADWCNKAYAGDTAKIIPCIGCQEACINEFVEGGHPQCAVNPRTAFEEEYTKEIPESDSKKYVAVIGAGPAGVTAAKVFIERGYKVDLYEKSSEIGGSIIPGAVPKIKYELKNYRDYLERVVNALKSNHDFTLLMETEAKTDLLKEKRYDIILTATGSQQVKPPIEGANRNNVVLAVDLLNEPSLAENAENIVVIGGGEIGAETAYFLKYEHNKNVKVVEIDKHFMAHTCTANRGHLIHYLERAGVELLNCTKVSKINENSVTVLKNKNKNVPNPYITWTPVLPENIVNPLDSIRKIKEEYEEIELPSDMVVIATGTVPCAMLYYECLSKNAAPKIYNLGDSAKPAGVFGAVRAAYRCARSI